MSADPCVRKARSDVALKAFLSFSAFGATVGRQSNAIETRVTVVRVLRQGVVQHRIEASFLIAVLSSAEWLGEKSRRNGDFPWITPPSIKMSNFPCLSLRGLPYLTFRLVFFFFCSLFLGREHRNRFTDVVVSRAFISLHVYSNDAACQKTGKRPERTGTFSTVDSFTRSFVVLFLYNNIQGVTCGTRLGS